MRPKPLGREATLSPEGTLGAEGAFRREGTLHPASPTSAVLRNDDVLIVEWQCRHYARTRETPLFFIFSFFILHSP